MSDWIGANVYRIENFKARSAAVALSGGKSDNGTSVVMYNNDPNKNDRWMFVHLGIGDSGKEEFHIINRKSGTFMSSAAGAKQARLTGETMTPWSNRTRWNVIPTRNQTGTYWITAAAKPSMKLVAEGEDTSNGAFLQIWEGPKDAKGAWWYLVLDDDAILQSPDLGKAPKP